MCPVLDAVWLLLLVPSSSSLSWVATCEGLQCLPGCFLSFSVPPCLQHGPEHFEAYTSVLLPAPRLWRRAALAWGPLYYSGVPLSILCSSLAFDALALAVPVVNLRGSVDG